MCDNYGHTQLKRKIIPMNIIIRFSPKWWRLQTAAKCVILVMADEEIAQLIVDHNDMHLCWLYIWNICICSPTYQQNMSDEPDLINRLVTSRSLVRLSREYVVDLWVYDDHFAAAKPIKVRNIYMTDWGLKGYLWYIIR